MDTIDRAKLKTELLAIKARLESDNAFDTAAEQVARIQERVSGGQVDEDLGKQRDALGERVNALQEKIREKSVDALEQVRGMLDWLEEKVEDRKEQRV